MEVPAAPDPRRVDEPDGVEHERVALPASHRVPHVVLFEVRVLSALAVVGRDDAVLTVATAGIASHIEEGDVVLGLPDSLRRPLPRNTQRLARHDRIVFARPHIELLDLVPVLRFVHRATQLTEPRGRVELEVLGLIRASVAWRLLRRTATASA